MIGRTFLLTGAALALVVAPACGRGPDPGPAPAASVTAEVGESAGLTDLARTAVEQLEADPRTAPAGILTSDPTTWWVTMTVDVPLDEADFDDPLTALPPPLDAIGPAVVRLRVRADGPLGLVGATLGPPFTGLAGELDGSNQVVTTIPGDDPPPTNTWRVGNARLTTLVVAVADFDATPGAGEIIAFVGPEHLVIGPAESIGVISVAAAEDGVPAIHPPLTGTWRPPPEETGTTPDTTAPDPGGG